jgi:hypothetical protein
VAAHHLADFCHGDAQVLVQLFQTGVDLSQRHLFASVCVKQAGEGVAGAGSLVVLILAKLTGFIELQAAQVPEQIVQARAVVLIRPGAFVHGLQGCWLAAWHDLLQE